MLLARDFTQYRDPSGVSIAPSPCLVVPGPFSRSHPRKISSGATFRVAVASVCRNRPFPGSGVPVSAKLRASLQPWPLKRSGSATKWKPRPIA